MECDNCGKLNPRRRKYCDDCGYLLGQDKNNPDRIFAPKRGASSGTGAYSFSKPPSQAPQTSSTSMYSRPLPSDNAQDPQAQQVRRRSPLAIIINLVIYGFILAAFIGPDFLFGA